MGPPAKAEKWLSTVAAVKIDSAVDDKDISMVAVVQQNIPADQTVATTDNDSWGTGLASLLSEVKQIELTNRQTN